MAVGILGTGSYLPKEEVTSAEIASYAGTTEEWILRKTKIATRRFAAPDEVTSDLAARAGEAALAQARLDPSDVDVLIVSTSTPDSPQPPTACVVQALLGCRRAAAFDVNIVCSGFVYALELARSLVLVRGGGRILVIAADLYSHCLDFGDRRTAALLGDGAGAAVVGPVGHGYGILATDLTTHGEQRHLIRVEAGGTRLPASHDTIHSGEHYVRMEGRQVHEFVLTHVPPALTKIVATAGVGLDEVAHLVPHQPNGRLLDELADRVALPSARLHRTVERYGNVGSASVPVTLDEAHRADALRDGDLVLLTAFGGGMAMAQCLLRWRAL